MNRENAVVLLLYHFLLIMTLSQDVNSEHRGSIVLLETFQYVCHLSHVARLLQSNYGKLMLPTSLGTTVWGGDQCVITNSNSIVFHGFQLTHKENVLRIAPLSTSSLHRSNHEQVTNPDRHQWIGLCYMALPLL